MTADISVPLYVYHYVIKEYGQPPYNLEASKCRGLKIAFYYYGLKATAMVPPVWTSTSRVNIQFHYKNKGLALAYKRYQKREYNSFLYEEFWQALKSWVDAAQNIHGTSRRSAIRKFLEHYQINDDVLSLENAYRMFTRFISRRWESDHTGLPLDSQSDSLSKGP